MEDLTPKNRPTTPLCLRTYRTDDIPVEYYPQIQPDAEQEETPPACSVSFVKIMRCLALGRLE